MAARVQQEAIHQATPHPAIKAVNLVEVVSGRVLPPVDFWATCLVTEATATMEQVMEQVMHVHVLDGDLGGDLDQAGVQVLVHHGEEAPHLLPSAQEPEQPQVNSVWMC